jgi:hypothetical protein
MAFYFLQTTNKEKQMNTTESKTKLFWSKHKTKIYIVGAATGGILVGCLISKNKQLIVNIGKNAKVIAGQNSNVVVTELERRGHPGFKIAIPATGEVFASKNRAMSVLDVSYAKLQEMIKDGSAIVLGEMQ